MTQSSITITLHPHLDRGHHEIARLIPAGSPWAFIEWPLPPDGGESPILRATADMLCRALLRSGRLAFRWDDDEQAPDGEQRFFPKPARPILGRLTGGVLPLGHDDDAFGVLTTEDPDVAAALFAWSGWIWAGQAVIVFDPALEDARSVITAVRHGLDWRRRPWPSGARLLFGPGHDGAFAAVAGVDAQALERFVDDLRNCADGALSCQDGSVA